MAAALTCPYCSHAIVSDEEAPAENCPSCAGELLLAYRYRLIRARGEVAGGFLYEAVDSGFAQPMAALFVADASDREACERFVAGHRLFANLRTRGLVGIHEVSRPSHRRPYVIMDWLAGSTLDRHVGKSGPLDPTLVWAMASNLLIGFERAHRALPALVHGQVHPGKIGFRRPAAEGGTAVLFGFEWARQVSEQDSALADSFSADADVEKERASSLDLRALARTIVYAATGKWIEDGTMARQRQQAAGLMSGPMSPFIDRMLAAGTPEGYRSTSVARDEFELIRAGGERRRPRTPTHTHEAKAAEAIHRAELFEAPDDDDESEYEELDEHEDHDEPHHAPPPPARPSPTPAHAPSSQLLEQIRQRQAQLAAAEEASKTAKEPAKSKLVGIALTLGIGTCMVGSILADLEDEPSVPTPPPMQRIEAVQPIPDFTIPEPPEISIPEPMPAPTFPARKWSAKVEGSTKGPIKAGSKCELWVTPDFGSYNCKWAVDCKERGGGWTRYYGNDTSGLGLCTVVGDEVMYVSDLEDNDGDGLFVFDATAEKPWALIGDRFAKPARVALLRFEGEGELAEKPSHTEPQPLERLDRTLLDDEEFTAAGALLDELGASVGLELNFAGGDSDVVVDEALPATLDIFSLQATVEGIEAELLACDAPEGSRVDVSLTIEGSIGKASTIDLTNTVDPAHDLCLRAVLSGAQFDRFSDETQTVSWQINW